VARNVAFLAESRRRLRTAGLAGAGLAVSFSLAFVATALLLGRLAATHRPVAVLAVVVLGGAAVVASRPVLLATLAVPMLLWTHRLGPAISYADAGLAASSLLALPALSRSGALKLAGPALRASSIYLSLVLITVVANPSGAAVTEWVHRIILINGAVVVGVWVTVEGTLRSALRLLAALAAFLAVAAAVTSVATGFQPAYPLGFHKNFVGSACVSVLLLLVAAPDEVRLPARLRVITLVALGVGILATQSRGAMLGATLGTLIWLFRSLRSRAEGRGRQRGRVLAVLVGIGLAYFSITSIHAQLTDKTTSVTSATIRVKAEAYAREIWRSSPITGVGLRYFNSGRFPGAINPTNAFDSELAEAGLIGTAGFTLFHLGLFRVLWRLRSNLGVAALAVMSARFLHGQIDIYWSAGVSSLPFVVLGAALARQQDGRQPADVRADGALTRTRST
jgi:hypothetical protein